MNRNYKTKMSPWRIAGIVLWVIVFILQMFLLYGKTANTELGKSAGLFYFIFSTILIVSSDFKIRSYQKEFKYTLGPLKYYSVKFSIILITIIMILFFGLFSYRYIDRYFSLMHLNYLIFIHFLGFSSAVILAALLGQYLQRTIFNKIDKP